MAGPEHLKGIVTGRLDIAPDLWIVRIRPETAILFQPGQYLTVGLPVGERLVERPYSVASSPRDFELEFFLEAVPEGKLSPQLYEAPVGAEVYVRPAAKGRFLFEGWAATPNHFMAATVTGVAPFVSMVRQLAEEEDEGAPPRGAVAILQAASHPAELGYRAALEALASARAWLRYIPTISRPWQHPDWPGERGRVEDVARKYLDGLSFRPGDTTVYLCGNPRMIRNMEGVLDRAGFSPSAVKKEIYFPGD